MISGLRRLRYDWRFVMVLFAVNVLIDLIATSHVARFAPLFLRDELSIPEADIPRLTGLVAAASMLVAVPLSPFWGALADRYSRKWLILRAGFAEIVSFGLIATAGDIWTLLAGRMVFGFAHGSVVLMIGVQTLLTPPNKVGLAIGVIQAAFPLAASLGPLLGTLLIKTVGLREMFVFDILLVAVNTLLLLVFMVEPPRRETSLPFRALLKESLTVMARVPAIRWSFIYGFLMNAAVQGLDPFVPIAIQQANATSPWGWDDPTALGITLGVNGMVTAAVLPLLGRLTDWLGAARLMALSALLGMVCVFSLFAVESLPAVWALLLVLAIPQATSLAAFYAYLGTRTDRTHRMSVLGLTPLPRNTAWLLAPTLNAAATGLGFGMVFLVTGGFWALATGAALRLQRLVASTEASSPAASGDTDRPTLPEPGARR